MLPGDIAIVIGVSVPTASRWLREGRFGPSIQIGRRRMIFRNTFLEHLESLEQTSENGRLAAIRPEPDSES
jgi:predicted site-specific integrase-resolvase